MNNAELLLKAKSLPTDPGCYVMKDHLGTEIYVGKAKNLRRRVTSYFLSRDRQAKEQALIENIIDFDFIVVESEVEALLLESRLIKDLQPKYNVLLKHNEMYPYAEVTMKDDFPRVLVTRQQRQNGSRYFGPFTSATELRNCLTILGRIFKFRTCAKKISVSDSKRRFQRPCLNFHINRCSAPCADRITKEEYRRQIRSLLLFLGGKKKEVIEDIRALMHVAARDLQFERAAELRDAIEALESINSAPDLDASLTPSVPVIDPQEGLASLQKALGLAEMPRRIEGIDIAHLQGQGTVGSLVTFLDALPFKEGYRRYRITSVEGIDDFASIAEVVRRRYGRLAREGRAMPDIILIDGGKGQIGRAAQTLREIGVTVPTLMSLAKKEETPYVSTSSDPVPLSHRSAGLKLLMYVRDEAHRFAQHYHHILRTKALFEEAASMDDDSSSPAPNPDTEAEQNSTEATNPTSPDEPKE